MPMLIPAAIGGAALGALAPAIAGGVGAAAAPMAGMAAGAAPAALGGAATSAGPALMGGLPGGPGGLMGWLQRRGLSEGQAKGLPLAMNMMGKGMENLGGGRPPQAPPPAQAMNNPAAIQAAVKMMQQLRTPRRF